jgi:hypothetical protein
MGGETMKEITEEMGLQDEWYKEARDMTLENLPAFLEKLATEYGHDYGTICHAVSASAIAAAWAMEHSEQGGITGFQAGCVMWGFIRNWDSSYKDVPLCLHNIRDMLYPQNKDRYTAIPKSSWEWLQKEAAENIKKSPDAVPKVIAHWKKIVEGTVPFGYEIQD